MTKIPHPQLNDNLFVSPSKEADYCRNHDIELKRLSNGIVVVGIGREVSDHAEASIHFTFPSGSFFDPPGKQGLYHLAEHLLITDQLQQLADQLDINLNAHTSPLETIVSISGPAHPGVMDFGIWPILPECYRILNEPLTLGNKPQQRLDRGKGVIKAEIITIRASHNWQVEEFLREVVFDPNNPGSSNPLGTPDGITSITIDDIRALREQVFIPKGLTISFINTGYRMTTSLLANQIVRLFTNFSGAERQPHPVDWYLQEILNPDFRSDSGVMYSKDTGLKNKLITIIFAWPFSRPEFSASAYALSRLVKTIGDRLLVTSRRKAWAYLCQTNTLHKLTTGAFYCQLDIPKINDKDLTRFVLKTQRELNTKNYWKYI